MSRLLVLIIALYEYANLRSGAPIPGEFGLDNLNAFRPFAGKEFIQKDGLAIWRCSDHWRIRVPDPFAIGLAQTMAWSKYQVKDDPFRSDLPNATLGPLADELAKRLKARARIRVVGDPQTKVRRLTFLPGVSNLAATMKPLPTSETGNPLDPIEYCLEAGFLGTNKRQIITGHETSEEPGMEDCATWLRTFIPEVPIQFIRAGEPFWSPQAGTR